MRHLATSPLFAISLRTISRTMLLALLILMTLLIILASASPAFAKFRGFDSTVDTALKTSVKIEVAISDDLAYRANHLPKKLRDRGTSGRLNSAFARNGHYGEREIKRLSEQLHKRLTKTFIREGFSVADNAPTILRVTISRAIPNRPTFNQLSKDPGLSYQSIGLGGATLEGQLIDAGGQSLGDLNYKWYETDIRDAQYGGTWSDAHRAFSRYAAKVTKTLK